MSDTALFAMPLLDAAQAQKHVTVNEALVRADALAAARVEAVAFAPPADPADGEGYIVGTAASGLWAGEDDKIALFLNGGWAFVAPWAGAVFWVAEEGRRLTFDGADWIPGVIGSGASGAITSALVIEEDHTLSTGGTSFTAAIIPDKAVVIGVTARVTEAVTGASGWSLGVAGSADRYGSGYGTAVGSFAHGVTGQPQAYYGATALEIAAEGGSFTAGRLTVAVHCLEITPPA